MSGTKKTSEENYAAELCEEKGIDAKMYGKIDRFLGISWRSGAFWRIAKAVTAAVPFLTAGIITLRAAMMSDMGAWALAAALMLAAAGLISGAAVIYALTRLYDHRPEHIKALLESDGTERVYNDLINAVKVRGTQLYAGSIYVFVRGADICRIKDLREVTMTNTGDRDEPRAQVRFEDEFGGGMLLVANLTGVMHKTRLAQLKKASDIVEELKNGG